MSKKLKGDNYVSNIAEYLFRGPPWVWILKTVIFGLFFMLYVTYVVVKIQISNWWERVRSDE